MQVEASLALMLLAVPGVALLIASRLLFGTGLAVQGSSARLTIALAGWIMIWIGVLGLILAVCGLSLLALVLAFILVLIVTTVWVRSGRGEHQALLGVIAAGMQRGIPVSESARAMADEVGGRTGWRALRLSQLIEQGVPLDLAINQSGLRLSTGMQVAVRVGCAVGEPGDALTRELEAGRSLEDVVRPVVPRILYLLALINVGVGILTFMMLKIVPVFDKMFWEFDLELPAPTIMLVSGSRLAVGDLSPLVFYLNLGAVHLFWISVLAYVGVLPRDLPFPRWVYRPYRGRWAIVRWLLSPLRLIHWMFRRYDGAIVLRSLAWVVERGLPLPEAVRLVGLVYPRAGVRWQLLDTVERIEQGGSWIDGLRTPGLIGGADAAVLQAAQRAGNLPWAMREVSDSLLRREFYRWQWWYNIASPIAVVTFGYAVGFICIALFLPLIALIQGLAQ